MKKSMALHIEHQISRCATRVEVHAQKIMFSSKYCITYFRYLGKRTGDFNMIKREYFRFKSK